ncbi:MAG: transcription antitermination factor NusB [Candidatus Doudnabacteria bacterium RIFCSPLOWO2_01_FULL_44_21]|uniref:Transcription antitermination protein NusB n=1 Tax=Candidatus Doudnabacteria bacterium RIFCSPLOWO2_01_FULL_44_21 TaxID=1817841 RepID=A0A1F5PY92_9BACT|nr:MAG: transcription antitermination factor NusB [Candidatus Doudnabacteria bacterium RIFCSPHIGHO2_02_FULL_43_13b]OGE94911.1 MAG: transcription antitermination factor NusB [Candidatus Doudnabacteria bacterium RIFCSPLOWO2_01_FULL_44_21]
MANRHLSRTIVMQSLYEWDFNDRVRPLSKIVEHNVKQFAPGLDDSGFIFDLIKGVEQHMAEIDQIIVKTAPEWPLDQITVVDRNILRLGIYELMFAHEVPPKVAINEAVELGKAFGGESSGKFINGVLGTLYKQLPDDVKKAGEAAEVGKA